MGFISINHINASCHSAQISSFSSPGAKKPSEEPPNHNQHLFITKHKNPILYIIKLFFKK